MWTIWPRIIIASRWSQVPEVEPLIFRDFSPLFLRLTASATQILAFAASHYAQPPPPQGFSGNSYYGAKIQRVGAISTRFRALL